MRYYTIIGDAQLLIADKKETLSQYYDLVQDLPEDYVDRKYIVVNNELVLNPHYEEEQAEKEKQRIARLSLTKREVFLALYNDKNITPDMIRAQITTPESLIEFDYANDYFRGNPLINSIGGMLGYSSDDLDYLFEHKEFPPKTVEQEQEQEGE